MGDISKDFSFIEFKVSRSFPALAAQIELSKLNKYKLFMFVHIFLQPIRDLVNSLDSETDSEIPITVESGIRSVQLNSLVGGVQNSDHLFTDSKIAVDFKIGTLERNLTNKYLDIVYRECRRKKDFVKQFIYYYQSAGNFIHLSMIDGSSRVWERLYCVQRGSNVAGRRYFNSPTEAENFLRNI